MCEADACSAGGALLAQEPFAFRTVVTTGASAIKVRTPATAPPWLRGHCSRRLLSRPVTTCHSRAMRPVRCVNGFGHGGICCHSSLTAFPGWANEMACLQRMQTGAIPCPSPKTASSSVSDIVGLESGCSEASRLPRLNIGPRRRDSSPAFRLWSEGDSTGAEFLGGPVGGEEVAGRSSLMPPAARIGGAGPRPH